jgi:GT2 family glycosyltransferase
VKTARRPHLIVRLAKSVRETLGYDLHIVAYDDGPNDYSEEIWKQIAEYPLLKYVVSNNEDLGIARGRNLAIMQVKTKYLFLLDDDIKFVNETNLEELVEILDETDAVVAAGSYMGNIKFTGYFHYGHFDQNTAKPKLVFFHEACTLINQTIPNHPNCVRCDITSNVFLARTREILDIGGWDPEQMIHEHKDIFIRLKAAGMKVALCPEVKLHHARPSKIEVKGEDYNEKRRRKGDQRFVQYFPILYL